MALPAWRKLVRMVSRALPPEQLLAVEPQAQAV
jgi:hypothetical protein